LSSVTPTQAHDITCGDILGPGGILQLEHDLTCNLFSGGITIRDGAVLDLNGHRVTCDRSIFERCIVLTGKHAQLWNGTVQGGSHMSILLEGTGRHTVWNVTSPLVDGNILVTSDHNLLINVSAESVYNPAFAILGHHNRLTHTTARCPFVVFDGCLHVSGNANELLDTLVTVEEGSPSEHAAIRIAGDQNRLSLNRVTNVDGPAIEVTGQKNALRFNTAQGNPVDLRDTNGDCTHNIWKDNIFTTSDPACIGAGGATDKEAAK